MDNMLLTPEAMKATRTRAIACAKYGEKIEYDDELCRAQVQKVVEWMEKNNTATYVEKYNGWPLQLDEEHVQALRSAGVRS